MDELALAGLKIFQVIPAAAWGGGSVVILRLVQELVRAHCQVTVLCSRDPQTVAEFSKSGAEMIHARHWRRPLHPLQDPLFLAEIYRLCRQRRFDIVHTHMPKGGVIGRTAAHLAGAPLVVHTIHGFVFNEFVAPWRAWLYRRMEQMTGRFCDTFISVNAQDRIRAIELGITTPDRIVTVLNGIDLQPFLAANPAPLRAELGLAEDTILIGATGRLAFQKGFEYLLRALPSVIAVEPKVHLLLVGEGEMEGALDTLAHELGIQGHCHLTGFRRDIPALLAGLDFYAQPSLWEGLSISLLEAMAAGKPIVTTDIVGNRELIEDEISGLLVPPANGEVLATALLRLIHDPDLALRLAGRAKQRANQEFSAERMVQETLSVYQEGLRRKRRLEDDGVAVRTA